MKPFYPLKPEIQSNPRKMTPTQSPPLENTTVTSPTEPTFSSAAAVTNVIDNASS